MVAAVIPEFTFCLADKEADSVNGDKSFGFVTKPANDIWVLAKSRKMK